MTTAYDRTDQRCELVAQKGGRAATDVKGFQWCLRESAKLQFADQQGRVFRGESRRGARFGIECTVTAL